MTNTSVLFCLICIKFFNLRIVLELHNEGSIQFCKHFDTVLFLRLIILHLNLHYVMYVSSVGSWTKFWVWISVHIHYTMYVIINIYVQFYYGYIWYLLVIIWVLWHWEILLNYIHVIHYTNIIELLGILWKCCVIYL